MLKSFLFFIFISGLKFARCIEPDVDCLYGAKKDCSPKMSKEMYDEAAKTVFQILISIGKEWWPTEGTAMGILRFGQNFDLSNYSFSPIGTDTDIDIMIRVDDNAEWKNIKIILQGELKNASKHWHGCKISAAAEVGDKLTCWTNYTVGDFLVHTDIHRYQVNEKDNYAFMTQSDTLKYPFQKWNNKMVHKGGIADENGMLGVALYDDMLIPCALNIVEMLSMWNGGEYASFDIRWPRGGIIKEGTHFKWNGTTVHNVTENDKQKLRKLWNDLHSQGYLSFIENDPQFKRWNVEEKRIDRKQKFSAENEAHTRRWNVKHWRDDRNEETLMIVFYENLIVALGIILYRKFRK